MADRNIRMEPNDAWAELPLFDRADWKMVRLEEVCEEVSERVDKPAEAGFERFIGLEHMDSGELMVRRWGSTTDLISSMKLFRKGDTLFARRNAYLRRASMVDFDGLCSGDAIVLREIKGEMAEGFLPLVLNSDRFWTYAIANAAGSMSKRVNVRSLLAYEFALPPLDQQRRIAELLWALDEVLQGYIVMRRANMDAQIRIREAHFEEAINQSSTTTVAKAGKWMTGNTPSRQDPSNWGGSFPWVSPKDMKVDVLHDSEDHLTEQGVGLATIVPSGSLMIVVRGMILAHTFPVCITARKMAFNQDMKTLIPNERFKVEYIFHWFKWITNPILNKTSTTSHGTKRLMMDDFTNFQLPELSIEDQEQFIGRMVQFDEVSRSLNTAERTLIEQRSALIASIT